MWVPSQVIEWFTKLKESAELNSMVSVEALNQLQQELAAIRAERDALKLQIATTQNNFEWLRVRVNTLEVERAQLMQKAYGVQLPAPEIARTTPPASAFDGRNLSFDDVGDTMALELGFPTYDDKK